LAANSIGWERDHGNRKVQFAQVVKASRMRLTDASIAVILRVPPRGGGGRVEG